MKAAVKMKANHVVHLCWCDLCSRTFPTCTRQCVVVVGGENGDEEQSEHQSTSINAAFFLTPPASQDWEDEGAARPFSTVLVFDAEEGVWRPTDASWRVMVWEM